MTCPRSFKPRKSDWESHTWPGTTVGKMVTAQAGELVDLEKVVKLEFCKLASGGYVCEGV